jgi:hypothetical protein
MVARLVGMRGSPIQFSIPITIGLGRLGHPEIDRAVQRNVVDLAARDAEILKPPVLRSYRTARNPARRRHCWSASQYSFGEPQTLRVDAVVRPNSVTSWIVLIAAPLEPLFTA